MSAPLRFPGRVWFLAVVFAAGLFSAARAENLVTVRATVNKDYAAKRAAAQPPPIERYVVMKGRFFGGTVYDRSLLHKDFKEIVRTLARDLKSRQFFPAKNPNDADLLLLVHWGVTEDARRHYDQGNRDRQTLNALDDKTKELDLAAEENTGDANEAVFSDQSREALEAEAQFNQLAFAAETVGYASIAGDNAKLLGFSAAMENEDRTLFGSPKNATLRDMANEERYFIIVMAFDVKNPPPAGRKPAPVWVVRMSSRAAGINFHMAVDRISETAGRICGESTDGVAFERPGKRKERIEYGEMEVVEVR